MVSNHPEKDLMELRLKASACWKAAGRIRTERNPLVTIVTSRLEEWMGMDERVEAVSIHTAEEVGAICDDLILIPDASVQVMTLLSMWFVGYRSRYLGLISTFLASKEKGSLITSLGTVGAKDLRDQTHSYLMKIFDFNDALLPYRIEKSTAHWSRVLGGYADTYSNPRESLDWWDKKSAGERPTEKGIKEEAKRNYCQARGFFKNEARSIIAELTADIVDKREREIKEDLVMILSYIFATELSPSVVMAVLNEMSWLSRFSFPEKWLMEALDSVLPSVNLSDQLKAIIL